MRRLAGILGVWFFKLSVKLVHFAHGDAHARADHIKTTVRIAGFPEGMADELVRKGIPPAEAAKMFADALRPGRVQ
jgi:hypothetical protein